MSTREKMMLMIVGFVGVLVIVLVSRFSTDALGVMVGVILAMAGTIPALVIVAWLAGKNHNPPPPRHDIYYPPPEELYYRRSAPTRRLYTQPPRRLRAPSSRYVVEPPRRARRPAAQRQETTPWLPDPAYWLPDLESESSDMIVYDDPLDETGYVYDDADMW